MKISLRSFYTLLPAVLSMLPCLVQAATPAQSAGHLDARLAGIAAAAVQHAEGPLRDAALARQAVHRNTLLEPRWNAAGEVQVYIHYDPADAAPDQAQLAALGVTDMVDSRKLGVIQAWVPASQLPAVSNLPGVLHMGLPHYALSKRAPALGPHFNTGSEDTQGDTSLQAAAFRKATGDTGQGVTVAVISDGDQSIASSQKSGDLPKDIWDDPKDKGGKSGFSRASTGDEGTAMMEIIYDLAPGVSRLGFCGPQTSVDFITCLDDFKANISANVIVDDLGFPGEAMFTNDDFTASVESFAASNPSIQLVTAAGNDGTGFWAGDQDLTTTSTKVNGITYDKVQQFDGSSGTVPYLHLVVNPGDTVGYVVEWADPWSDSATANDRNDYDVVVFDNPNSDGSNTGAGHDAVACNQGINIGPDPNVVSSRKCNQANSQPKTTPGPTPVQGSEWTATQSDYYLEVFFGHGTPSKRLKILVFDGQSVQVITDPFTSGSIYAHAALASPAEITVGAVYQGDLSLESYSSTGPVQMGISGQAVSSIMKPDFVAPDCVNVTGAGDFPTPFCGTSAAAPHIAGLVALLMSGYPGKSPHMLLQESATPKGGPVPNGQYGYGLPNMKTLLNKGLRPTPRKSSGGGDVDLLSLLALGLAWMRRRP